MKSRSDRVKALGKLADAITQAVHSRVFNTEEKKELNRIGNVLNLFLGKELQSGDSRGKMLKKRLK